MDNETTADTADLGLTSATDLMNLDDKEMAKAFNLGAIEEPKVGEDGEPAADAILEAAEPKAKPKTEPAPKVEPEAPVEEPTEQPPKEPVSEPPKPVAQFKVFDKEGELEVPPELSLTYNANGKTRENVPLDRVVRLAQMGEYNEEREEQVRAAKHFVPELQQEVESLKQSVQQYEAWHRQILSDEAFRQRAVDGWALENTPEARAERAEAKVHELTTRPQREQEDQQAAAFVATTLVPRVTTLIEQNPAVSFEEVIGRFNLLTAPLMVRGQVPSSRLPEVQRIIESDLVPWVQARHATRELESRKVTNQVAAEQTKTTLAKRQLARATQPVAGGAPAAPKPKSFQTADEWLKTALPVPSDQETD